MALAVTLVLAPVGAQAADTLVVNHKDPAGDAVVTSDTSVVSLAQQRTIDVRRLKIERRESTVRFTIKIAKAMRIKDFDQMIFLNVRTPASVSPTVRTEIGLSVQDRRLGFAYLANGEASCDPLRTPVDFTTSKIRVDVPNECLPEGPVKVTGHSTLGYFRSEGSGWSRDRIKVPGLVTLISGEVITAAKN
jgi:hypothetical protein